MSARRSCVITIWSIVLTIYYLACESLELKTDCHYSRYVRLFITAAISEVEKELESLFHTLGRRNFLDTLKSGFEKFGQGKQLWTRNALRSHVNGSNQLFAGPSPLLERASQSFTAAWKPQHSLSAENICPVKYITVH